MLLNRSQLAKQAKVNVETVRYYERRGLIPESPKLESGFRQYPQDFVRRIKFIKRAQELGFTLKEIEALLFMRVDPDTTCSDIKEQAAEKIRSVDAKIKSLQNVKKALNSLVDQCDDGFSSSECPILDHLESEEQ